MVEAFPMCCPMFSIH